MPDLCYDAVVPLLSVVIPTHRRPATLSRCLDHLERQTIRSALEILVVSDGHDPATASLLSHPHWQLTLQSLEVPKSQQGVARNRGVGEASAPLVLFIGDDIFLAPDVCEAHLKAHNEQRVRSDVALAVLGFTTWDPDVGITPVMYWLERTGWQFGYPKIQRYAHDFIPKTLQHRFTYTSHLSLPRAVAQAHPFLADVKLYGWEDIAWGLQLKKSGVKLFYEPAARALHHHRLNVEDSLERMETLGTSASLLTENVPELDILPRWWKRVAYRLLATFPTLRGRHCRAFLEGVRRGTSHL